jgi:hypothetical protein
VAIQGNADQLMKLTGWHGANVLYIGDHVYTDLAVRKVVFVKSTTGDLFIL